MAYKTGSLRKALEDVDSRMLDVRRDALSFHEKLQGTVTSAQILNFYNTINDHVIAFNAAKNTPNLVAYAKTEKNDENYDIGVEFDAVLATIDVSLTWIDDNFPTHEVAGVDYILARSLTRGVPNTSALVDRPFPPAVSAGLRLTLLAIVAAISLE